MGGNDGAEEIERLNRELDAQRDRTEELRRVSERDRGTIGRLRRGAEGDQETIGDLQRQALRDGETLHRLRRQSDRDEEQIRGMEDDAAETERIERAQRALIAQLRVGAGASSVAAEAVLERLAAAERELMDLRAIRDALVSPALIQRAGLEIAAEMVPGDPQVGGDFFYAGDGPQNTAVVAVGDAVGKGLRAARHAAFTRTALASVSAFSDDPSQILNWVNVALVERIGPSAEFVTATCLTYDSRRRRLRFASAGHHPSVQLSSGEDVSSDQNGAALGLTSHLSCTAGEERLEPGDGVIVFTDGIVEARGDSDRYGLDRFRLSIRRHAQLPPREIIDRLVADARGHVGRDLGDDVCLLVLRAT